MSRFLNNCLQIFASTKRALLRASDFRNMKNMWKITIFKISPRSPDLNSIENGSKMLGDTLRGDALETSVSKSRRSELFAVESLI